MTWTTPKIVAAVVLGLIVAFLLGFVPQWIANRSLEREVAVMQHQLELSRLQGTLGAALAEAQRSNYERARQLMTAFFDGAQRKRQEVPDERQRRVLEDLLEERDEIITLLSRASAESRLRLNQMYTRYHAGFADPTTPPPVEAETDGARPRSPPAPRPEDGSD